MDGATLQTGAKISPDRRWTEAFFFLGVFALLLGALTWPTAPDMARVWLASSTYHHGFFVAPAAIWMIIAHSPRPMTGGSSTVGLLIVLAGALLWLPARAGNVAIVEQFAFVTILIGAVGASLGDRPLRAWAWPLGFLYFMVPAGESIVPALQFITADMVVAALNLFGVDVAIDGILIETHVGAFAIAEACAGLNVLIAALMAAAVYSYVSFAHWPRRFAFIAFAGAFAIAANAVRAFFLILIPVIRGEQADIGPDHYIVGWILYAAVLIALAFVATRFADRKEHSSNGDPLQPRALPLAIAAALVAAVALYAANVVERASTQSPPSTLSLLNAPGWRLTPPPYHWPPTSVNADRRAAATYITPRDKVLVALTYFTHDRRGAEIAGMETVSETSPWRRIDDHESVIYLFGSAETRTFTLLRAPEGRSFAALSVYWLGDDIFASARAVKIAVAKQKLAGVHAPGGKITLAAPYDADPEEAVKAIGRLTSDLEKFSSWRARHSGS